MNNCTQLRPADWQPRHRRKRQQLPAAVRHRLRAALVRWHPDGNNRERTERAHEHSLHQDQQ